jgi:hypothetical protein
MSMKNQLDNEQPSPRSGAKTPPRSGAETLCGDGEALIAYLYDECNAKERARMELHLQSCDVCATELAELGGAREQLAVWAPPDAALGFRVAAEPPTPAPVVPIRVAWWRQPMPVWGQAVAAMALFGLGMAAGNRGLDVGDRPAVETARATVSADALAQLESRMKQEIAAIRTASAAPAAAASRASNIQGDEAIMRQVRDLLRDSERRQEEAFAVRTAQLVRDAEIQRRVDQAQLQQTLTQVQGTTTEEVRRQREMLNYLVNVSQRR